MFKLICSKLQVAHWYLCLQEVGRFDDIGDWVVSRRLEYRELIPPIDLSFISLFQAVYKLRSETQSSCTVSLSPNYVAYLWLSPSKNNFQDLKHQRTIPMEADGKTWVCLEIASNSGSFWSVSNVNWDSNAQGSLSWRTCSPLPPQKKGDYEMQYFALKKEWLLFSVFLLST